MSRKVTSQWEFGELLPAATSRNVLTVAELTTSVKRALEKAWGEVWVSGEVTNLRVQSSGHIYFTLKDATAQLSCVLFRGEAAASRQFVQDGQKLILQGNLTVYEPRGQYQLVVRKVEPQGIGALQLAFEKLKRQLEAEGLFAPERKRPLPRFPQRIGLVTSPTGAALRDVLHVLQRRHPGLEIVLAPCRVQGEGAALEIAAALRALNHWHAGAAPAERLDLILLTRGGGSLEDLWAFNEETVARAIAESVLPVMSAVGHEIDFTISDFVADLRAATPSAAAEILSEGWVATRRVLADAARRLLLVARSRFESAQVGLNHFSERLDRSHPRRRLEERAQHLDELQAALGRALRQRLRDRVVPLEHWHQRLLRLRPSQRLGAARETVQELEQRLAAAVRHGMELARVRVRETAAQLRLLSVQSVLARGYSITTDAETGRVIRRAGEVQPGQVLNTQVSDGEFRSTAR